MSNSSGSTTNIQLQPSIDYFLFDDFSVGGFLQFDYTSASAGHASTFGLGPRVGYNFSFSDLLSLWPKVGFSYDDVNTTTSTSSGNTTTSTTVTASSLALNVFIPLMIHPAPHFFAGFGPFLNTDLTGDTRSTTWGGQLTVGGWIGL